MFFFTLIAYSGCMMIAMRALDIDISSNMNVQKTYIPLAQSVSLM